MVFNFTTIANLNFTIVATDDQHQSINQTFNVAVSLNQYPVLIKNISDYNVGVNTSTISIDLAPIFSDPENRTLTYNVTYVNGTDAPAFVSVSSSKLNITTGTITNITLMVIASDDLSQKVNTTFKLSIQNLAPNVTGSLTNVTEAEGNSNVTRSITSLFTDPENATMTYTITLATGNN